MNNYKRLNVYSQNDFEEKMYHLNLFSYNVEEVQDDKAFIQIIGTPDALENYLLEDTKHYFANCNADNVLNLAFDDVNKDKVNFYGVEFMGITDTQAEQIVDFIERHKGKNFYISCRAGKSRSQAVARYILDMYGEEYGYNERKSCRKSNPCLTPNINVLTKLKRAYYKKFNMFMENEKLPFELKVALNNEAMFEYAKEHNNECMSSKHYDKWRSCDDF